ncbi:PREDICTED: photosystem II D1 precursor processing protein PSB27-H2, chloroplastic isoform X2 [Lupinus angustifolius]|uniref:photosystem II D1 precursor processing protein PSB27-H2, chloroplastic isoform X2 n=1 Tax=Lupinus angustifolius TaxID=3871 RepID=UPI00092EA907|nr:PREDICTED: photosystem II D1 precursor processing protein PSB27-H2, chloroplastic isoform X2 [Lupinus angustifolius]
MATFHLAPFQSFTTLLSHKPFPSFHFTTTTPSIKTVCSSSSYKVVVEHEGDLQLEPHHNILSKTLDSASSSSRRHVLVSVGTSLVTMTLSPLMAWAQEMSADKEEDDGKGIISSIESLFDPNEKTKSGKVLPKAYLKSAREVVKTLRQSLNEASDDNAKFRRTADMAKESIREYLGTWRGQQSVVQQESYVVLEKAIRSLANFYSRAGPSTPLSEEVKSEILDYLNTAEQFL